MAVNKKGVNFSWLTSLIPVLLPVIIVVVLIVYFGKPLKDALQNLLNFTGLTDSQADKDVQAALGQKGSAFDPNFFKTAPAGTKLRTHAYLVDLSKQVHDAIVGSWGFTVYVDGNAVFSTITQLPSQAIVSQLSSVFTEQYQADMLGFMKAPGFFRSGLNSDTLDKIIQYVNALPKYT